MENNEKKSDLIEELEKNARKKKGNNKRRRIIICCLILALLAAAGFLYWKQTQANAQTEVVVEAGEGEELKYVTVGSIVGNEITGYLTENEAETVSIQVPVGTTVITRLGMETTFSRISAGNNIVLLLKEGTDNILKIWIVQ